MNEHCLCAIRRIILFYELFNFVLVSILSLVEISLLGKHLVSLSLLNSILQHVLCKKLLKLLIIACQILGVTARMTFFLEKASKRCVWSRVSKHWCLGRHLQSGMPTSEYMLLEVSAESVITFTLTRELCVWLTCCLLTYVTIGFKSHWFGTG